MKKVLMFLFLCMAITANAQDTKITVKSISTSPSTYYGSNTPKMAIDGDYSTFWHSQSISSSVTVYLTLSEVTHVDYVRYVPRQDGSSNGNWGNVTVTVYAGTTTTSTKTEIGTYNLGQSGSSHDFQLGTSGMEIGKVKFVITSGYASYASAAELECYKTNSTKTDEFKKYFSDNLFTHLKPGITSSEGIEDEDVKTLVDNMLADSATYQKWHVREAKPYRTTSSLQSELRTSSQYSQFENPTAMYATAGTQMLLMVEGIGDDAVSLKVKNWVTSESESSYSLKNGLNYITPSTTGNTFIGYYTDNYKTAPNVRVHLINGKVQGYWDQQTMTNADWKKIMAMHTSTKDSTIIICQSEHAQTAYPAYIWRTNCLSNIDSTMTLYEEVQWAERDIMGLKRYGRETANHMLFYGSTYGFMAAGGTGAYCNITSLSAITKPDSKNFDFWGVGHEWGHNNQINPGFKWTGCGETTNNIYASWAQIHFTGTPNYLRLEDEVTGVNDYSGMRGGRMETYFEEGVRKGVQWQLQDGPDYHGTEPGSDGGRNYDHFVKLVPFWQLNLWGTLANYSPNLIPKIIERLRKTDKSTLSAMNNGQMQLNWIKIACDSAKINLLPFFEKAGMFKEIDKVIYDYSNQRTTITTAMLNTVRTYVEGKKYPEMTEEINYVNGHNYTIYRDKKALSVPSKEGTGCTLSGTLVKVLHSQVQNAVAYETYNSVGDLIRITMYGLGSDDNHTYTQVLYPSDEDAAYIMAVGYDGTRKEIFRGQAPKLKTGKYYTIVSTGKGGALTGGSGSSVDQSGNYTWSINRATASSTDASQIWAVVSEDSKTYVYNPQTDAYLGGSSGSAFSKLYTKDEAAYFSIESVDQTANTWTLALNGSSQYLNAYSTTSTGYYTGGSGDSNNIWTITEATTFNVKTNSYGFLNSCLPFAYTLPDNLTANIVKEIKVANDTTYAVLEEITGTIPAKTPVILVGKKSTTFSVVPVFGDTTAKPEGNLLKGGTMKVTGFTKNTLIKTVGSAGTATGAIGVLKQSSATYADADKSYLLSTDITPATTVYLIYEKDIPTAIEEVRGDQDGSKPQGDIYDLQGRRVNQMQNGGIYIIGGRKIMR